MTPRFGLASPKLLALALTSSLLVSSAAPAAARSHEDDENGPPVTVLDESAKVGIGANLKAHRQEVVVTRFSVAPGAGAGKGVSQQGCPSGRTAAAPTGAGPAGAVLDPQILDAISAQLTKRLTHKNIPVAAATSVEQAPASAVIISGCITRFEAGDANKRIVGMRYGASRLYAHVRVQEKQRAALKPVVEFDVAITGGSALPPISPIGLAVHVAMAHRQALINDARTLGNRVSNQFEDTFLPGED